jgi:hypothetical protein
VDASCPRRGRRGREARLDHLSLHRAGDCFTSLRSGLQVGTRPRHPARRCGSRPSDAPHRAEAYATSGCLSRAGSPGGTRS